MAKLQITGKPFPVVENVTQALNAGNSNFDTAAGQLSISTSGSLVFASGGILPDMQTSLVWVDHSGKAEPVIYQLAADCRRSDRMNFFLVMSCPLGISHTRRAFL